MADNTNSPRYVVSDACISFSEVLISCRGSVVTLDEANAVGQDLSTWFQGQNALTDDCALFAKRSVALAIIAIQKNGTETVEDAVELIKDTYLHYVG